jgi:alkaline phosphatase D
MRNILTAILFFTCLSLSAQRAHHSLITSGPMIGHVDLRTATIWVDFASDVKQAEIAWREKGSHDIAESRMHFVFSDSILKTATAVLTYLEPGTTYSYRIMINGKQETATGEVTTQQLWHWRKQAPDFSFITGSCAYFNQPEYDRPPGPDGKLYGGDSSIFQTMAKEKADFMLWLGDNWYTREADYYSEWGLNYRATRDRSLPVLQPFWKAMPHYAIWDDHDYGWNDADKSYPLKKTSREVFKKVWPNPSYGEDGEGVYTKMTWNDVDIFMLDDRWFRNNDRMKDSVDGKPNPGKKMFGNQQLEWLKNSLLGSQGNVNISFRIIATGSQVLNPYSPLDCFHHYPVEYNELMNFIQDNNINGVVFLTGDRHHSEIIKADRAGTYPLYDITSSPLTSGTAKTFGAEINNPSRVGAEIDEQNYTRISFSGPKINRKMTVEFISIRGQQLGEWSVMLKDISVAK